jgi:chromate transporter
VGEVFLAALRLGLTSFGGPAAHLGYFRREYVDRRRWLDDSGYAEVVAIAQFLPGPTSSQIGAAVGYARRGAAGAAAAWLGFTLPSAVAMALFARFATTADLADARWLTALKLVAVAVVLDAVLGMARTLTRTLRTAVIAVGVGGVLALAPPSGLLQVGCLVAAGLAGLVWGDRAGTAPVSAAAPLRVSPRAGVLLFGALLALVGLLPAAPGVLGDLARTMVRAGALVFGGGHVVLPLLRAGTVPDLVPEADFLSGYGAAQAVPGPLFTFASFLGEAAAGPAGAALATVSIFLPGLLLFFGVLPFWTALRRRAPVRAAVVGVNAGVVGLLAAAWIDPITSSAVHSVGRAVFAAVLFALLRLRRVPPVVVVALAVIASPLLDLL